MAVHATTKAPIDPMSEPTKTCFYDSFSLAAALLAGGGSHTPKFVISLGFERLVGYVKHIIDACHVRRSGSSACSQRRCGVVGPVTPGASGQTILSCETVGASHQLIEASI